MTDFQADPDSNQTARVGCPESLATALRIVDQLIRRGVQDAVVCPGSRNSPLSLALVEAERAGRLRLHVRTDERTAAFLALGLAKYDGSPAPIIMTSGTAVANCMPAVVEATMSHVPVLVVSADRPRKMVGTGANQTIDQEGIFGKHVVASVTVSDDARDRVNEACDAALDPITGGAAHVNVPFAEPLVPTSLDALSLAAQDLASQGPETHNSEPQSAAPKDQPTRGPRRPLPHGQATIDLGKRTLVIAGSVTDRAWARAVMDELADVPTIAEPVAPAPDFPVHPAAAGLFSSGLVSQGEYSAHTTPEQIVVVGRPTLHRAVSRLLANTDIRVVVVTETSTVTNVTGNVAEVASSVRVTGEHPAGWESVCQAVSDLGAEAVREALNATEFSGAHAMAVVADSLRDGDAAVIGASSTIRDAARAGMPFDGVATFANRGAAGIDGTISTAVGIAMSHARQHRDLVRAPRTVAVMGDLTFLHDLGGLNIGPLERRPENLLIVVINDAGGGIFETLEPGSEDLRTFTDGTAAYERVFGTPVDVDMAALCDGFGVTYHVADSPTDLAIAIDDHAEAGEAGITVIEARVSRAERVRVDELIAAKVAPR
ncbi:2-succinyl-5-enolpyruvyl-6-hydroxy-3-cyclohexene-1-carboxylic-acid synthase [Corynebacterium falsenii]|uniref:2-succinyl-5-enolpyruvyl-6-hydroxy-3- cyclohexene-1-carboxylic-acid synthase n=1 Tax=Corynebacterium falsenii TaxID=108486 RepID=UPI001CCA0D97|nr:2-succinyl-5-enolpyruvyl-6-hydroxy-3-cyclohexene-1-carboxylic-acid synthase [Corynebacterium falsenii]MDC7103215.1 2-succinyl-5-enolpyruvyl-6-hydroxy-3-cyclohexene-1-carboxylic-acid synthase [Corynebacterium falsenii]UBI04717.1 2-succinyl-5-enolpyruvyl-6-hydroxy-3-cyclohexene-1-carboxylic-acid synthase [Corynebacterium falsenii]